MSKVTVLGGGGWAIALAKVLNENGHNVTLWSALEREVEALAKERVYEIMKPYVKVRKSTLNEDSGLIGAAYLAFSKAE